MLLTKPVYFKFYIKIVLQILIVRFVAFIKLQVYIHKLSESHK